MLTKHITEGGPFSWYLTGCSAGLPASATACKWLPQRDCSSGRCTAPSAGSAAWKEITVYSNQEQKILLQCVRNTLVPRPEKKDNKMYGTATDEINIPVPVPYRYLLGFFLEIPYPDNFKCWGFKSVSLEKICTTNLGRRQITNISQ